MSTFRFPKSVFMIALTCTFALPVPAQNQAAPATGASENPLPLASSYAVTQRTSITVTAVEHAHLLTEMNGFLNAINDINSALAAKDFGTVAALAEKMGPKGGKHDAVGKLVHDKLPQEWFALAKPIHKNFLAIANEAKSNPKVEAVLARVASTTQQCVACHAMYKLTVAP